MQTRSIIALIATTTLALSVSFTKAYPTPGQQQQKVFGTRNEISRAPAVQNEMYNLPYTFDTDATGAPELSDILAQEKSATIALDAILRSEPLVRALSGDSSDFKDGLTLLLPTNKAFQSLDSLPDDLDLVMKKHFIAHVVTPQAMADGVTVHSYGRLATLRFSSSQDKVYVQADHRNPVEVRGAGVQAGGGIYFLVDELFL
ncbi:hypothetical protein LPJ66_005302 [Kickxella alabastrina]|uniref:Uncharacterized protein n=1 Tax=Kickxella alabastrina TaxID=61397 RepID=A0ACC1IFL6_9FUNG|nr:hypothetical protein LPJ66_005302 [Kickxella alabastrina]